MWSEKFLTEYCGKKVNTQAQILEKRQIHKYKPWKSGELDFVIYLNGKPLPIEVKSSKDYETHRALSNIVDYEEYGLSEAAVFNNNNLYVAGKIAHAHIYMAMFL